VSADHFVVCIQNHDQVGNRAGGERLSTLLPLEKLELAAALLLLSPYVPLLFMGEEYGETNPFQYFVSHTDPELVEAVRTGRRKEFESFGWADRVPDPSAEETFAHSRLDRTALDREPWHRELLAMYRDLLRLRRTEPALRPGSARVNVQCDAEQRWLTLGLTPPEGRALCAAFNLDDEAHALPLPSTDGAAHWTRIFSTDESRIDRTTLAPFTAALFALMPDTHQDLK